VGAGGAAVFLGSLAGYAIAQVFSGPPQQQTPPPASPYQAPWYTGNAGAVGGGNGTMPQPNPYGGWATATAGDTSSYSGASGGRSSAPEGAAATAPLPSATRWSRSPPVIPPQVRYGPQPQMYTPVPGAWDPRVAQPPPGYPTAGGYGSPGATGAMPAMPFGQYAGGTAAPAAVYQPAPYAPPVGNAFMPPPLPGGFAAPPPEQVRPQTVAPQATMPETTVPQTTVVQPPL